MKKARQEFDPMQRKVSATPSQSSVAQADGHAGQVAEQSEAQAKGAAKRLPRKQLQRLLELEVGEIILPSRLPLERIKQASLEGMKKFQQQCDLLDRRKRWAIKKGKPFYSADYLEVVKEDLGLVYGSTIAELVDRLPCFDWRLGGVVPLPRDQGNCGSCWAYVATAAFESRLMYNVNKFKLLEDPQMTFSTQIALSVQGILDCVANSNCRGGLPSNAFSHIVKYGARMLDFNEFGIPFDDVKELMGRDGHCTEKERRGIRALAWGFVFDDDPRLVPTDEEAVRKVKEALLEHGPLAVLVRKNEDFKQYTGGVFNKHDPERVNHAVLLIGWDDARRAWIVLNSSGKDWGNSCCDKAKLKKLFPSAAITNLTQAKGCMYIQWGTNSVGMLAAWIEAPFAVRKKLIEDAKRTAKGDHHTEIKITDFSFDGSENS